jgi:hypothetical protein
VDFDETFVGGKEEGVFGRARVKKEPIAIACEHSSTGTFGRIRMARLPDASALVITDVVEHKVESGSVLLFDNWTSYEPAIDELAARGLHDTVKSTTPGKTKTHLVHPHVHRGGVALEAMVTRHSPRVGPGRRPGLAGECPTRVGRPRPYDERSLRLWHSLSRARHLNERVDVPKSSLKCSEDTDTIEV